MTAPQKYILIISLLVIIASFTAWAYTGFEIFSKQQVPIRHFDEILGTTTIVWEDATIIGLDIAGTVALVAAVIGGISLYLFRHRKK